MLEVTKELLELNKACPNEVAKVAHLLPVTLHDTPEANRELAEELFKTSSSHVKCCGWCLANYVLLRKAAVIFTDEMNGNVGTWRDLPRDEYVAKASEALAKIATAESTPP